MKSKKLSENILKAVKSRGYKYIELEANKTLQGKFRLIWFVLIASIRDWNVKD